jgi:signal transduction histidine kinase
MSVQKWLLPTLSEVLAQSEQNWAEDAAFESNSTDAADNDGNKRISNGSLAKEQVKAEQQWQGAIAALEHMLRQIATPSPGDDNRSAVEGFVLCGPSPIFSDPQLNARFPSWIFTPHTQGSLAGTLFQLPPAEFKPISQTIKYPYSLPLLPADPLAAEQFCLILSNNFSLAIVLGEDLDGQPAFLFSFDLEVVQQAWATLRFRMLLMQLHQLKQLDELVEQFPPIAPDYRTVMKFSRLLLKYLPDYERKNQKVGEYKSRKEINTQIPVNLLNPKSDDIELLQAFAHEVRTPLTTIRMLTRLLLKRKDVAPDIIKRLEYIDHECTEQIERMELLFQAAEIETSQAKYSPVHLTTTSLDRLLEESIPRWQKQASRRNLTLEVQTPQQLPPVVSDPTMLDRILTGLIENFTRNLPAGSHIQIEVTPAGNQLKVQLQQIEENGKELERSHSFHTSKRKQLGHLLMFQPETGSICLNHSVTKNIFQALGGKLIVKERPQQGEVMTIFLPIVKGKR